MKATFERIVNKEFASPKATEFAAISSIETPDEYTVVFKLAEPASPLLAALASGWGAILPKSLIDAKHDFAANPVGTGPFVFKEWVRDNRIVLAKNPDYWMKGLPKFDSLIFQIIPERAVQVQGLASGQIDASDIIDEEDVPTLEASGKVNVERPFTSLILVLAMNCSKPPLNDVRVRQAVNLRHRQADGPGRGLRRRQAHRHLHELRQPLLQGLHRPVPLRPGQGPRAAGPGGRGQGHRAGDGAALQLPAPREGRRDVPGDALQGRPERADQAGGLAHLAEGRLHGRQVRLHGHRAHRASWTRTGPWAVTAPRSATCAGSTPPPPT